MSEQYVPEPNEDRQFASGNKTFRGFELAPWSQGARMIWLNLSEQDDHIDFMLCSLVWILVELNKEFMAEIKTASDVEKSWFLAKTRMCARVRDKDIARGRVIEFMEQNAKGKQDLKDTVSIALKILDEVDKSEMEASQGGGSLGESPFPASHSKSRKSRKKQDGAGKQ